jgi:hypothetical protein
MDLTSDAITPTAVLPSTAAETPQAALPTPSRSKLTTAMGQDKYRDSPAHARRPETQLGESHMRGEACRCALVGTRFL